MSLWNIGEKLEVSGAFEIGGGEMEPIPANTELLAYIEQAKWDGYDNDPAYISLKWKVAKPEQHKGRVIFQKLKVCEDDEKKRAKAVKMLAAIDANCKGQLIKIASPKNEDLMKHLANQMMKIKVQIWKMEKDGSEKTGNWISSVAPKGTTVGAAAKAPVPESLPDNAPEVDVDDIEF